MAASPLDRSADEVVARLDDRFTDVVLGDGPLSVFDLTGPTISHHLKVLRQAGLIAGERRGTQVCYRTVPEVLRALSAALLPADRPLRTG